jgi:hypothetical protein
MEVVAILFALLHVVLAATVYKDARRREGGAKPLYFLGPMMWALAALAGGLAALALYWAIHYSTLRDREDAPSIL